MSRKVPKLGLAGRPVTRATPAWGQTGRSDIADERRHHQRELVTDRRTGETYEVKSFRCTGERKLNARICSRDRDNKLYVGYSDKL